MRRSSLLLTALLLVALLAGTASRADAAPPYSLATPGMRPGQHMPGWDWWRTYPWSPYNYGRNPYNPIILPYPYPYPMYSDPMYSDPTYRPTPSTEITPNPAGVTSFTKDALPTVSGPLTSPPPGSGMFEVRVPENWATVLINGQDTVTSGKVRYFVTPRLQPDKAGRYTVSATWREGSVTTKKEQTVSVERGQKLVVDFTRSRR